VGIGYFSAPHLVKAQLKAACHIEVGFQAVKYIHFFVSTAVKD
jgi:hypothetical protein